MKLKQFIREHHFILIQSVKTMIGLIMIVSGLLLLSLILSVYDYTVGIKTLWIYTVAPSMLMIIGALYLNFTFGGDTNE